MVDFVPTLLSAVGGDADASSATSDRSTTEALLSTVLERAHLAHPDLDVDLHAFVTYLGQQLAADGAGESLAALHDALGRVLAGDIYLAYGCLAGEPRALARFDGELTAHIPQYVARYVTTPAQVDELTQRLRVRLLVRGDREPQLVSYRGRGPLGAWLRVVAVRAAIDLVREIPAAAAEQSGRAPTVTDPELAMVKARFAPIFQRAFEAALTALPSRERTMLRLHFAEGMSQSAIARSFNVAASTIQRTISRVREHILEQTLSTLGAELGVDASQAESIVRLVQSRIDVDLRDCLATRPTT